MNLQGTIITVISIYSVLAFIIFFLINSNVIPSRKSSDYTIDIPAELYYIDNIAYWKAIQTEEEKNVIILHGFTRNSARMNKRAKIYWELGYNVYMIDNLGHGKSGPILFPSGIQYSVIVKKVIEELDIKNPILHGASMGAIASSFVAQHNPQLCKFIICEALPHDFDKLYKEIMVFMKFPYFLFFWLSAISKKIVWKKIERIVGAKLDYDVTNISCPMYLIHGNEDKMFRPSDHYYKIVEEMKERDNFQHWLVPDSKHTRMDGHKDYQNNLENYIIKYQ